MKLQTRTIDADVDDGSQEGTWTTQATLLAHIHGSGRGQDMAYGRSGLTRTTHMLMHNQLPKRILGHWTLADLLNAPDTPRVRFLADNRTLSFESLDGDMSSQLGEDLVRLACVETPQPIGYMDE